MALSKPRTIVLFGGTGFLGRYAVPLLTQTGNIVRVVTRDLAKAQHLKINGATGQVVPLLASTRADTAIDNAVKNADAVINLLGIFTKNVRLHFKISMSKRRRVWRAWRMKLA